MIRVVVVRRGSWLGIRASRNPASCWPPTALSALRASRNSTGPGIRIAL